MTGARGLLAPPTRRVQHLVLDAAGGPARARVVLTLAAVLGLSGADTSTENNLERAFHIGNTQIGLLLTVVSLVGAAFTLPMGILVDRTSRVRLLSFSIALWAVAVLFSGVAQSYPWAARGPGRTGCRDRRRRPRGGLADR